MYAEGSCDSDVLSCDRYNTQLRVDLSSLLLLLVLFAYILPEGCTLLVAWLRGSSLRFLLRVLLFVLPMYPLHLDRLACVEASILLGERWLCLRGVPLVVLSCVCSLVGD